MSGATGDSGPGAAASPLRVGVALGGVVLAAVIVFGLGVMVGTRVTESVPVSAPPPTALPTETLRPQPPPPGTAAAVAPEQLTFYDRLSGAAPPASTPLPEAAPQAPPPVPAPAGTPEPPVAATAALPPERTVAAPPPTRAPPRPPAPAATSQENEKSAAVAQIRSLVSTGRYAVQVASLNDRDAAYQAAARVRSQGFDSVVVAVSIKGTVWYRIRVGTFPSQQAAKSAAGLFRTAYGFNAIPVRN